MKTILIILSVFFLSLIPTIAQTAEMHHLGLTLGVQFKTEPINDEYGNYVGDNIYAYNSNNYEVYVSLWMDTGNPSTYNVSYNLANGYYTIQPGQTVYMGTVNATDRSKAWSYSVQWQVNYDNSYYYWYYYY